MRTRASVSGVLLVSASLAGCSSLSATYLGNPKPGQVVDGMPVVVERPRYMRVTISNVTTQLVLEKAHQPQAPQNDDGFSPPAGGATASSMVAESEVSTYLDVTYDMLSVGEVYAIDFKRPASGTGEFSFEFEPGKQYPKKLTGKMEDKTIKDLADAIGSIAEKVAGLKPTSQGASELPPGAALIEISRSVSEVWIYDLDRLGDPNYHPVQIFPPAGM